jgi:hypothetical protein
MTSILSLSDVLLRGCGISTRRSQQRHAIRTRSRTCAITVSTCSTDIRTQLWEDPFQTKHQRH